MSTFKTFVLMLVAFICGGANLATAQIDLAVDLSFDNPILIPYQYRTLHIEVSNTGTQNATGVGVDIQFPLTNYFTNFISIFDPSQGVVMVGKSAWYVGDLAAGQTASLDITFQPLSVHTVYGMFVQIMDATETDLDSTPDNNTTQIPQEDDEAYIELQVGDGSTGNGDGTGGGDGDTADSSNPSVALVANATSVTGIFNVEVNFSEPVNGLEPEDIVVEGAEVLALYGGTQYYTITVRPLATDIVILTVPANAAQDEAGNGNTVSTPLLLTFDFQANHIDLALDLTADKTEVNLWENVTYRLEITNSGTIPASDIQVAFGYDAPNNPPLALVGQNLSLSEYDSWNGLWKIDYLGVGESRILELTLFALEAAEVDLFAQVMDAGQVDIDSFYANDDDQTVDEDDEASVQVSILGNTIIGNETVNRQFSNAIPTWTSDLTAYPNPTKDWISIQLLTPDSFDGQLAVFDALGRLVNQENWKLIKGSNEKRLDFEKYPVGIYTILVFNENQKTTQQLRVIRH